MLISPLTRQELIGLLPKGGAVAELGVNNGRFSQNILKYASPGVLHLVDPWGDETDEYVRAYSVREDMGEKFKAVSELFAKPVAAGQVVLHRAYSTDAISAFGPETLDWVYIDAMHSYEAVYRDLTDWAPAVKRDGFILGHDFSNTRIGRQVGFGVLAAVLHFLEDNPDHVLVAVTNEAAPSFAIAKSDEQAQWLRTQVIAADHRVIDIPIELLPMFQQRVEVVEGVRRQIMGLSPAAPSPLAMRKKSAA